MVNIGNYYRAVLKNTSSQFLELKYRHEKELQQMRKGKKFSTFFFSSWLATIWETMRNWSGARRETQTRQEAIRKQVAHYEAIHPSRTKALYMLIEIAWVAAYSKKSHITHNKHEEITKIMKKYVYLMEQSELRVQRIYDLLSAEIEYSLDRHRYKEEEMLFDLQFLYERDRSLRMEYDGYVKRQDHLGIMKDPQDEYQYLVSIIIAMMTICDYPDDMIEFVIFRKLYPDWERLFLTRGKVNLEGIDRAPQQLANIRTYIQQVATMLKQHAHIKRAYTMWSRPLYTWNKVVDGVRKKDVEQIKILRDDHPFRYSKVSEFLEQEYFRTAHSTFTSCIGLGVLMLISKGIILVPVGVYDNWKAGHMIDWTQGLGPGIASFLYYVDWMSIVVSIILSFVFLFVVAFAQRRNKTKNRQQMNFKINNILAYDNKNSQNDTYPPIARFTNQQEAIRSLLYVISALWSFVLLYFTYDWINTKQQLFDFHIDPVHFVVVFLFVGFSGGISFYLKDRGEEISVVRLGVDWIQIFIFVLGLGLPVIIGKIIGHWLGDAASSALPWLFDRMEPVYKLLVWMSGEGELRWIEGIIEWLRKKLEGIKQRIADFAHLLGSVFHK